jgi:hypothetical protein
MTFTYPIAFAEHYRAYRTAFHRKPAAWLGYAFFVLLPVGISVAAVAFGGWTVADMLQENGLLLMVGPVFVVMLVPILHRMNVRQARTGNRTVEGDQHLALTSEGFRAWGSLYNTSVLWSAVNEVVETRSYFLIYLSELQFYFLPKSVIAEPEQLETVRALLQQGVGERARLVVGRKTAA